MDYVWDNPAGNWVERGVTAHGRPGRFDPLAQTGAGGHRRADIARLAGARKPACGCAAQLPPFFDFCPNCGAPVPQAYAQDPRLPLHVPHGLPVAVFGEPREGLRMPAPPNAEAVFISARLGHAAAGLLALAPRRGILQYWDPCAEQWLLMEGPAGLRFGHSQYGWLTVGERSLLVPTEQGIGVLTPDLVREYFSLDLLGCAAPAAAPGRVGPHTAVPVMAGGGIAFAAGPDFAPGSTYVAPQGDYEAPFSYDGMLWWLHHDGLLRWDPARGGSWQAWPAGWRPCLATCKPAQSRAGQLWLCGHDGTTYSFLELGGAMDRRIEVDGLRAGWANFVFRRGHEVRGEPWDEPDVEDLQQHDSLVIPLLRAFNSDRARPTGLVLRLPAHAGRAEDLDLAGDAYLEWIGATNRILDRCPRLHSPLDLRAFLHDGSLWVHHPSWSLMRGWRLAP
jgi:hypothetical protein